MTKKQILIYTPMIKHFSNEDYSSPEVKVMNVQLEGLICGSLTIDGDNVQDDSSDWGKK